MLQILLLSLLLPAVFQRDRGAWLPRQHLAAATWDTAKVVTAFTAAHSITLSLAALGTLTLPSRWVESAIAASVVLAALNNVWPVVSARRWVMAFAFGLIHGFGFAAVLAVLHDTIITIGLFSLFNKEISLTVVAALLTLVGYSMNDTIVVFDRIRETLQKGRKGSMTDIVNRSINETLSRTIMTSGLTFLTAVALWLFGGQVLNGFAFALVVGIMVGTYSSIFVASPILVWWQGVVDSRKSQSGGGAPAVQTAKKLAAR